MACIAAYCVELITGICAFAVVVFSPFLYEKVWTAATLTKELGMTVVLGMHEGVLGPAYFSVLPSGVGNKQWQRQMQGSG
jgi:DNA-directed RNA polymerase subunit E'/Rpb7